MGQTRQITHSCGYTLIQDAVIDTVDVGLGLPLPPEARTVLRRDEYNERCYLPVGTLLYWYDGSLDMQDWELATHEVQNCPQCGEKLPMYTRYEPQNGQVSKD